MYTFILISCLSLCVCVFGVCVITVSTVIVNDIDVVPLRVEQ